MKKKSKRSNNETTITLSDIENGFSAVLESNLQRPPNPDTTEAANETVSAPFSPTASTIAPSVNESAIDTSTFLSPDESAIFAPKERPPCKKKTCERLLVRLDSSTVDFLSIVARDARLRPCILSPDADKRFKQKFLREMVAFLLIYYYDIKLTKYSSKEEQEENNKESGELKLLLERVVTKYREEVKEAHFPSLCQNFEGVKNFSRQEIDDLIDIFNRL